MSGPFDPKARPRRGDPRNARIEQESQLAMARGAVQRMFDAGQLYPRDRFGNKISKDDLCLWDMRQLAVVQVIDVGLPEAEKGLPPTMITLTLALTVPYAIDVQAPANELIKVGSVQGEGHATIAGPTIPVPPPEGEGGEETPPEGGADPDQVAREREAADRAAVDEMTARDQAPPPGIGGDES